MARRECLDCTTLIGSGTRCPRCAALREQARGTTTERGLGWQHQQAAAQVLAHADICMICGLPPTSDDPLTAGHVVARVHGGQSTIDNLQPEHRSCNSSKGAGQTR
ncbi:HNH endonuclease [Microtetraspora malaysiensis]|uniref:HNH endonuclease n=1 Tax=Microtetraspora malaysiensis TaxID=161358 RepID=UPI003D8E4AB9